MSKRKDKNEILKSKTRELVNFLLNTYNYDKVSPSSIFRIRNRCISLKTHIFIDVEFFEEEVNINSLNSSPHFLVYTVKATPKNSIIVTFVSHFNL